MDERSMEQNAQIYQEAYDSEVENRGHERADRMANERVGRIVDQDIAQRVEESTRELAEELRQKEGRAKRLSDNLENLAMLGVDASKAERALESAGWDMKEMRARIENTSEEVKRAYEGCSMTADTIIVRAVLNGSASTDESDKDSPVFADMLDYRLNHFVASEDGSLRREPKMPGLTWKRERRIQSDTADSLVPGMPNESAKVMYKYTIEYTEPKDSKEEEPQVEAPEA